MDRRKRGEFWPALKRKDVFLLTCFLLMSIVPARSVVASGEVCKHDKPNYITLISSSPGEEFSYSIASYCYSVVEYKRYHCKNCNMEWQENKYVLAVPHDWKISTSNGRKGCGTKYQVTREQCQKCQVVKSESEVVLVPMHIWEETFGYIDDDYIYYSRVCKYCGGKGEPRKEKRENQHVPITLEEELDM